MAATELHLNGLRWMFKPAGALVRKQDHAKSAIETRLMFRIEDWTVWEMPARPDEPQEPQQYISHAATQTSRLSNICGYTGVVGGCCWKDWPLYVPPVSLPVAANLMVADVRTMV